MGRTEGPISQAPWSPDFLAQSLELLMVYREGDRVVSLRPVHAASLQLGWRPGTAADAVLTAALGRYGLAPVVLHSTSWRHDGEHVVLTYLAVVEAPGEVNENLAVEPVARADLARGAATSAPGSIEIRQVLEHALRHLAWLIAEDEAVASAIPDWRDPLWEYVPEPFRAM